MKNRRSDWSFRLKEEFRVAENGYFLTFTYSNEKLPKDGLIPILQKDHLTNFIKRLREEIRKISDTPFRYYAVGEYGTESERPHYHILGFNIPHSLLTELPSIWGYGHVDVGRVEDASIHYVSKFHMNANKEDFVDQETGEVFERPAEFATMSRGNGIEGDKYQYGIGHNYVNRAKKWHRENRNNYVINNGFKQRIPRYYKDKIFDFHSKKLLAAVSEINMQKDTVKECKRLAKLGYKKPFREIWKRAITQAHLVKEKNEDKGKKTRL